MRHFCTGRLLSRVWQIVFCVFSLCVRLFTEATCTRGLEQGTTKASSHSVVICLRNISNYATSLYQGDLVVREMKLKCSSLFFVVQVSHYITVGYFQYIQLNTF